MRVLAVDADTGLAHCAGDDGTVHTVEIALAERAAPGAVVLVHADVAIGVLDRDRAAEDHADELRTAARGGVR